MTDMYFYYVSHIHTITSTESIVTFHRPWHECKLLLKPWIIEMAMTGWDVKNIKVASQRVPEWKKSKQVPFSTHKFFFAKSSQIFVFPCEGKRQKYEHLYLYLSSSFTLEYKNLWALCKEKFVCGKVDLP